MQYGNLSNFVMAHYWNLQDELVKYEHTDFLYPRIYTESGQTGRYTPRTLIFDTKDMYGYYAPYEKDPEESKFTGEAEENIAVYENIQVNKSLFAKYLDQELKAEEEDEKDEADFDKDYEEIKGEVEKKLGKEEHKEEKKKPKKAKKPQTEEEQLKGLQTLYAKFKFEESTQYWIDYSQVRIVLYFIRLHLVQQTEFRCLYMQMLTTFLTIRKEWRWHRKLCRFVTIMTTSLD